MNPFDRYNRTTPDRLVFKTEDKAKAERVGQFLRQSGYHPRFNLSPVIPNQFEAGFTFQIFVPTSEGQAVGELMARYEMGEFTI